MDQMPQNLQTPELPPPSVPPMPGPNNVNSNFTAQTMSVHTPPSRAFRIIFLILLIAVLGAASLTSYILLRGRLPKDEPLPLTAEQASEVNPFIAEEQANPFAQATTTTQDSVINPFEDTTNSNPFDQFENEISAVNEFNANPF